MHQAAKRLRFLLTEAMKTRQPAQTFIRQLGDVNDLIRTDIDRLAGRMLDAYHAQSSLSKLQGLARKSFLLLRIVKYLSMRSCSPWWGS